MGYCLKKKTGLCNLSFLPVLKVCLAALSRGCVGSVDKDVSPCGNALLYYYYF